MGVWLWGRQAVHRQKTRPSYTCYFTAHHLLASIGIHYRALYMQRDNESCWSVGEDCPIHIVSYLHSCALLMKSAEKRCHPWPLGSDWVVCGASHLYQYLNKENSIQMKRLSYRWAAGKKDIEIESEKQWINCDPYPSPFYAVLIEPCTSYISESGHRSL